MSSTVEAINGFIDLVNQYKEEKYGSCETILGNINKVRTASPTVFHQKHVAHFLAGRAAYLKNMTDQYLVARLAPAYPQIKPELFNLKRYLGIKHLGGNYTVILDKTDPITDQELTSNDGWKITTPLFATVELHKDADVATLYNNEISTRTNGRVQLQITSKLPGKIGGNLHKTYRQALAKTYHVLADVVGCEGVGDVLTEQFDSVHPKILVAWIPTASSLSIKTEIKENPRPDPAMLLKVRDLYFLLATWYVDDEKPFDRFLKEYMN